MEKKKFKWVVIDSYEPKLVNNHLANCRAFKTSPMHMAKLQAKLHQ